MFLLILLFADMVRFRFLNFQYFHSKFYFSLWLKVKVSPGLFYYTVDYADSNRV